MTNESPNPQPPETLGQVVGAIIKFFTHRNVHKLAGTAVAALGLVTTNHFMAIIGAAYAAVMHYVGGQKGLPD